MLRTTLLAFLSLVLFAFVTLPSPATCQAPPEHIPSRYLHGWVVSDFAASKSPDTPYHYYVVDGTRHIVVIDARDGHVVHNVSFLHSNDWLGRIAVDARGYVYVTASSPTDGAHLKVFDAQLRSLKNVTLTSLQPAVRSAAYMQVIVDSTNSVYLFQSTGRPGIQWNDYVWVLGPRQWLQQAAWQAPLSGNRSDTYVIAIDNQDYLYFQAISGYKTLYITDQDGQLQYTYTLGSGSLFDPRIDDVAIDSQMQMWHTHAYSTMISVHDSNAKLIATHNVLSTDSEGWRTYIEVDQHNNVIVADRMEQALLLVSPKGDISGTLSSEVAPMWYLSELLTDYAGGGGGGGGHGPGAGSLLFGDWNSPYVVQRMSANDRDAGTLLQRYSLPGRLSSTCSENGIDIGMKSSNIYVLLECFVQLDHAPWYELYSLIYVMAQSGRVVSEFRVHDEAIRVRSDESAGLIYVGTQHWNDPALPDWIVAYSIVDGTARTNYTTSNPSMRYITDLTLLPPLTPGAGPTLVAIDYYNGRFVNIDPSGQSPTMSIPFPNHTYCQDLTFSYQGKRQVYYVSCEYFNQHANGSYVRAGYVHKWDITDPTKPMLTDAFVAPQGVDAYFGSIAVGLDGHLYAYEYSGASVWQWRDADGPPPAAVSGEQQNSEPRVHVGQPHQSAAVADHSDVSALARMAQPIEQNRHRMMRGLGSQ